MSTERANVRAKRSSRSKRGGGNGKQSDHFERQAESFANIIGRDFRRSHVAISGRPTARPQLFDSPGSSLPRQIRFELEKAFGADFSAVRIHTNADADEAARSVGAEAFTSGTNIYFRNGMFAPHFDRGRQLLAHELTHVLQQTGRLDGMGRLKATPMVGTGEVQCHDDSFIENAEQNQIFDAPLAWLDIKAAYASVPDIATHIAIIEKLLPSSLPASASQKLQFHALVFDGKFTTYSNEIKGIYVDALKLVGAFPDAHNVLVRYPKVSTSYRSQKFYEYVRQQSLSWMPAIAATDSFAKSYYPDRVIAAYESFLFMPGAQPLELDPGKGSFATKIAEEIQRSKSAKGLKDNELRATMLLAFWNFDQARMNVMRNDLKPVLGPKQLVDTFNDIANAYVFSISEVLAPINSKEIIALFDGVHPKIKEVATKAAILWNRVIEIRQALRGGKKFRELNEAEVQALAKGLGSEKKFSRLRSELLTSQKQLLVRPGGNLISPKTFAERVQKIRKDLAAAIVVYSKELWGLVPNEQYKEPDGLRLSLAIALLSDVEYQLSRYDSKRDLELAKQNASDERVGTRIRLARTLSEIGKSIGWHELEANAKDVFKEKLQVALMGDWTEDKAVSLGSLGRYVGEIGGLGSPITGQVLDRLSYTQYFIAIAASISNLLQQSHSDPHKHLYKRGISEATKIVQLPRRFIIENWELLEPQSTTKDDKTERANNLEFAKQVALHPLTKNLKDKEAGVDYWFLGNGSAPRGEPLVIWIVPNKKKFVLLISRLAGAKKLVNAYWAKHRNDAPPDPLTDWQLWLDTFQSAVEVATDEEKQEVADAIAKDTSARTEQAEQMKLDAIKEAVNFQRGVVRNYLKSELRKLANEDGKRWWSGDEIFRTIAIFAQDVEPREDEAKQVSALTIEIASELQSAFGDSERNYVIDGLLTLSWAAISEWVHDSTAISKISPLSQFELYRGLLILKKIRNDFTRYALKRQKRRGLEGNKGKDLRSVMHDRESWIMIRWKARFNSISEKQVFDWGSDEYVLEAVHENFTFYPAFSDFMEIDWKSTKGKNKPGSAFLVDGDGNLIEPNGRKLFTITRKPFDGPPVTKVVTDKDIDELHYYHDMVNGVLAFEYIGAGARFLTWYANVLIDVIEFLPGVGQLVTATRFTAQVLSTLADPDFRKLLASFKEDGFGAITKAFDTLAEVISPAGLIGLMLKLAFDTDFIEKAHNNQNLKGNQTRSRELEQKRGPWSQIARMLRNLVRVGVLVLDRIKRLVHHVQTPVRSMQLWVLQHPTAALLLDRIDRNFYNLSDLTIEDLADLVDPAERLEQITNADWKALIEQETLEATNEVVLSASKILDPLGLLELPEEVVPVDWIVDFVIDLVVQSFGGKYRKPLEAVRAAMRKIGVWDKILNVIKENVFVGSLDPNEIYREHAKKRMDELFTGIRNQFASEVADQLGKVKFLQVSQAKTKAQSRPGIGVDFNGIGFPEAEAYGLDAEEFRPYLLLPSDVPTSGPRLPLADRLRAEAAFGHDLRHVRLHRDAQADRITSALGAQAITSGSHVFLRSNIDLHENKGRHILNHELAHVVQQTGERPLGSKFSDQPTPGRPNKGLKWDAARESVADNAASRATRGEVASGPIAMSGGEAGIQPLPDDLLRQFLQRLHSEADLVKARNDALRKPKKGLSADHATLVANLAKDLDTWIKKKGTFEAPFGTVEADLRKVVNAAWPEFVASLPLLVSYAVTTVAGSKEGKVRTTEEYIPFGNLKVEIERELFGLTGFAFVVELNEIAGPAAIKKRQVVNPKDPVKSVSVAYLHLPLLPPGTAGEDLWNLLIKNTYLGKAGYDSSSHDSFKAVAKLILGRGTPSPDIFHRAFFKLSDRRAKVISNQRDRLLEFVTKKASWPTVVNYTRDQTGSLKGSEKNLGLRVGTYNEWRSSKTTGVQDRDAHHTVQFLLLEYFRNTKGKKPFPFLGKDSYPGVSPDEDKTKTKTLQKTEGKKKKSIKVGEYFEDHGGKMTTVYLARHTHQSNIHYRSEPPDEDENARATQGNSIDAAFNDFLGPYSWVKSKDPAVKPVLSALAKNESKPDEPINRSLSKLTTGMSLPITYARTSTAIFNAAQKTYADMWTEMKPKLKRGLEVQEVAYYNTIAKLRNMTEMKGGDLTKIYDFVIKRTEEVIGQNVGFGA